MVFKSRTATLSLLAILMAAWVIAPTATAQTKPTMDMALTPPAPSLVPESQPGILKATVYYEFASDAQIIATPVSKSLTVTFKFTECPASVLITGPNTKILTLDTAQQGTNSGGSVEASFQVTMTREAPGLKTITCKLTASAPTLTTAGVDAPDDATQSFSVSADYYALIQPKIAQKLIASGPDKQVPFSIELTNYGNARTQINFEVGSRPTSGNWELVLPDPIILDSPYAGGEGKTVDTATVTISSAYKNGWNNAKGAYQILMKVASADQPDKKGNDLNANILVRVRGVYVPGLEPFVMLAAILGSALVLRLQKQDE